MTHDPVILESWLNRNISMVRYAETKNATLLAAITASLYFNAERSLVSDFTSLSYIAYFLAICVGTIIIISLVFSFLPSGRIENYGAGNDNYLYYSDATIRFRGNPSKTIKALSEKPPSEADYIEQILQNAQIADKKMHQFSRCCSFSLVYLILAGISYV